MNHSMETMPARAQANLNAPKGKAESAGLAAIAATVERGLHTHRQHLTDAVLFEAASGDGSFLGAFEQCIKGLERSIDEGGLRNVNEKIDGCMSIVFGFDTRGEPFVAYKGGFSRSKQVLLYSLRDLATHYPAPRAGEAESGARKTLKACIQTLLPALRDLKKRGESDLLWQADVLCYEGDGRRELCAEEGINGLVLQANQVRYVVSEANPHYKSLNSARLALAVHTLGVHDSDSSPNRLKMAVLSDQARLRESVSLLNRKAVCAIDPFRTSVALTPGEDWAERKKACNWLMKSIHLRLKLAGPAFREEWGKLHLRTAQVFFNSFLRPPSDGGIYRLAAKGAPLDTHALLGEYEEFCERRLATQKGVSLAAREKFKESLLTHRLELTNLFEAYFEANKLLYKLLPVLTPVLQSKLGGESEGIMLEEGQLVFKLVDRLGFTMRNNAAWQRRSVNNEPLPEPLDVWRPGDAFFICGWRIPHKGHVSALREILRDPSIKKLHVLASPASSPRLDARTIPALHAAETKKALRSRDYRCVLSGGLRMKLGALAVASLDDPRVDFHMLSPSFFWEYVSRAQAREDSGRVLFAVGEKELRDGRYHQQLNGGMEKLQPLAVPMQEGGLSASDVRSALKGYVLLGSSEALTKLNEAMSYIEDPSLRTECILEMAQEWRETDKRAQGLLEKESRCK